MSRYKAFERIFHSSEDSAEDVSRIEEKLKYHNKECYERQEPISLSWYSTDDEQTYQNNLTKRPEMLEQYGWKDYRIDYNLNKWGFRESDFNLSYHHENIIATGECFTFGTGLNEGQIWPTMVEWETGTKVWNLGLPLAPLDVTFRILYSWLPVLKPKQVLLLENSQLAREVWIDETPEPIGFFSPEHETWKRALAEDKAERYISRQKNLMAINELCAEEGVELLTISASERHDIGMKAWETSEGQEFALCRDLMHPGFHFQRAIADRWLEEL